VSVVNLDSPYGTGNTYAFHANDASVINIVPSVPYIAATTPYVASDEAQIYYDGGLVASVLQNNSENINVADAGNHFIGTEVEAVLQEVGSTLESHTSTLIEATGNGVITGLTVTAQATPNMTVAVATGTVHMPEGKRFTPVANSALAITAANITNPRKDIVYVSSTGIISYLAGTAAASPVAPNVPAGGLLLAEISVAANATTIVSADITDKRLIKNNNNNLQSQLADITNYQSVTAVSNIYTLDLSKTENFLIETTDTNAKTIALSNIPQTDNRLLSVGIRLKYTNAASFTYPSGITWQNGTSPSFIAGKKYWILLQSADKGVSWLGSAVGAW
jgi:hypothetical protein